MFSNKKAHGPVDMISRGVLIVLGLVMIKFAFSGISMSPILMGIFGFALVVSQVLGFFM